MRGKEEANELAHRGTRWPEPTVVLPLQSAMKKVTEWVHKKHKRLWFAEKGLRQPQTITFGSDYRRAKCVV